MKFIPHIRRHDDIYDFQPQIDVNSSKDMCKIGSNKVLAICGKIYHRWTEFFFVNIFFHSVVMWRSMRGWHREKEWHNLHSENNYFSTSMNFLLDVKNTYTGDEWGKNEQLHFNSFMSNCSFRWVFHECRMFDATGLTFGLDFSFFFVKKHFCKIKYFWEVG